MTVIDRLLRAILTSVYALLRAGWFVRRPRTFGAHALALTPEGRIILVRLRYAPGWRLPGGGRSSSEPPLDAALRELREEIGMISHGEAKAARDFGRMLFAGAVDDAPDKQGRVTVPAPLRAYAGLTKDCVVIGANTRLEIWDAATWATYEAEQDVAFAEQAEEVVPGLL